MDGRFEEQAFLGAGLRRGAGLAQVKAAETKNRHEQVGRAQAARGKRARLEFIELGLCGEPRGHGRESAGEGAAVHRTHNLRSDAL